MIEIEGINPRKREGIKFKNLITASIQVDLAYFVKDCIK